MEKFTDKENLGVRYIENEESDFFVNAAGYDDFNFVAPLKSPHVQNMYTLHFVLSGSGTLSIYGKSFPVQKYDMFFIPPGESMCYYPAEDDPWRYIWVEMIGEKTMEYIKLMGFTEKNPVIRCRRPHDAYKAVYDLFSRINSGAQVGYFAALAMFYSLVDAAAGETEDKASLYDQVKSYIASHFHDPRLTAEGICRDFNVSHSTLCRAFAKNGESVCTLLIEARLAEACRLLSSSNLSVGEICYSSGFSDYPHFMKSFRKHIGMPAGEYRRRSR